jgi:hypothetical protein
VKTFTVEQANAALRELRPLAERMVELTASLARRRAELEALQEKRAGNGEGAVLRAQATELERRVERQGRELAGIVERIHAAGAQVKDLAAGLLDFPSERDGETVLLCWRVGEDGIGFWHGLDEGFAGRKPLA